MQTSKKDKDKRHRRENHQTTGVNTTKVAKKNKDKDLNYIECYTYT